MLVMVCHEWHCPGNSHLHRFVLPLSCVVNFSIGLIDPVMSGESGLLGEVLSTSFPVPLSCFIATTFGMQENVIL